MGGDGRGSSPTMNNAKFNPTMAVIIVVLIAGCFMVGFISVFVRKCMSASSAAGSTTAATGSQRWSGKTRGLDKAAVDALPIVHSADLDEKHDRECPVCLMEFEGEDSLRLLPACKHVFHQECIDAWFDAHSTCPLCRASLTDGGGKDAPPAAAQPVETIVEVSVNSSDSDVRARSAETRTDVAAAPSAATISQEDERSISAAGGPISREDELNSARGMLSRNSQSFKRAARGTTALENVAPLGASGAPGTSKPPTAPKPPLAPSSMGIRRTSTDLIALRNLLTGDATTNSGYRLNRSRSGAAASTSWFSRARSMELSLRSRENWSHIDLESGKPPPQPEGDDRAWSDRWSLASLRGAMFPLSRSASDTSARTSSVKSWS